MSCGAAASNAIQQHVSVTIYYFLSYCLRGAGCLIVVRTANMPRLLRPIIALALSGLTSTTVALGSSNISSATSSPASSLPAIEVDVIFPIRNATYNITESLPIVFALQNTAAAAALGPFTFSWDIMPYGKVGETQEPGGVFNDFFTASFTAANSSTEPYIFVNQTDVQKWRDGPFYPYGSVYALQWAFRWTGPVKTCSSDVLGVFGTLFFNININAPEPDLVNLIGQCPQLGGVKIINTTATNSNCSAIVSYGGVGDPCAVTLNKAVVGNISSTVQNLVAASAAAASPSPTATLSPTPHSLAVASDVPLQYVLVVLLLLGSLQMVMFS